MNRLPPLILYPKVSFMKDLIILLGSKTAIYISHRLASTKFCDRIAVFEDGRIIEYGTHDELMKRNGVYCNMFTKQAEYYIDSAVGIEK